VSAADKRSACPPVPFEVKARAAFSFNLEVCGKDRPSVLSSAPMNTAFFFYSAASGKGLSAMAEKI